MPDGKKYNIEKKSILAHELIGLRMRVVDSSARERIGLKGRVIDETKNTLKIDSMNGEKVVPKKECVFEFTLPENGRIKIEGEKLCFRPEDRVKEYWRKAL